MIQIDKVLPGDVGSEHLMPNKTIHSTQTKTLRHISDSPRYFRNDQIAKELEIPYINIFVTHLADNLYTNIPNIKTLSYRFFPTMISLLLSTKNVQKPFSTLNFSFY
ncbi:hypothetical protein CEXT_148701 [Caerostris extrusa]|uniref:Uncharacterized protein n=1 Tax=Caerostris extrusa TaxID=172846 RepID=A0AAV4YBZ0_CAEEX|nr:hypothetical protein CEXT_148701 [Caerostris extrusa]